MEEDKDTMCPILYTFSDATAMEIFSCLSKVGTVQTIFWAASSKNLVREEWKILYD